MMIKTLFLVGLLGVLDCLCAMNVATNEARATALAMPRAQVAVWVGWLTDENGKAWDSGCDAPPSDVLRMTVSIPVKAKESKVPAESLATGKKPSEVPRAGAESTIVNIVPEGEKRRQRLSPWW